MPSEPEFYVGYLPIPTRLKNTMRLVVAGLGLLAAIAGAILLAGQHPFAASTFEFQQYREFRGILVTEPYAALVIPGQGLPWLLVGPGKHGTDDLRGLNGRTVQLMGERIYRGNDHMIEIQPGSLRALTGDVSRAPDSVELGQVSLTGEIVDSKCYFGVMNPGNGKVHRDCAVRCISGGIPPAFLVRDGSGRAETLLLANWKREWLDHIAEPITLHGRLVRSSGRLSLYAE